MPRKFAVLFCITLALFGCKAKELVDNATAKDTRDLMTEVADDSYDAPADGRLTDAQVQMYLKVREHEKKIAQQAKAELKQHADKAEKKGDKSVAGLMEGLQAMGAAAEFLTADIKAAKELGYNTQEYIWVKGQIMGASTAAMAEKMNEAMSANFDQAYNDAKKAYDQASDEQTKKIYADMLAGYDKTREEMKAQKAETDPAAEYNKKLLSKYENALNAWGHEMAKYEDKEGETEKALEKWQQEVEAAKKQN